ncbi:MAG TPA: sigma-70 family RNA polymerase sigma factor [Bryobacteraceae bacterium]|jgi:RNA polymerase sigma-70 factor (ECF subfamily)|nr:sigma-70 family RNA polymerase sigma factor [Bryobacteraceae bacterium]
MNDAIEKAQRGDRDAFRLLVEQHSPAVFRLAYRMTHSETDAEDIVQDTFLRAWKQLDRFDSRAAFGTWLHRICANCSLDHLRRRKPETPGTLPDPLADLPHGSPSPERLTLSVEIGAVLVPALAGLSPMERAAFVMRHYEALPVEEISRALGVEPNAARHSIFRAVQKLRKALEPLRTTLR